MSVIQVNSIGKHYKRYPNRWSRLAEWLGSKNSRHEKHWVLRDVSFDVRAGESIGIIGHNGAGKSTLLKLITGTTQPSTGSATVTGRVAALLELGMGFHPDFAGRQNAYMSGQLLGYSNEEIAARMHDIEAFAEIGDYIDQPVRTYSSGMQVRLAFSVATCIRPDVLIVDEALSVGDIYFQQKCFERIQGFAAAGTTLLFVSHSMGTIVNLCDRAIYLKQGSIVFDGDPKSAVDLYQAEILQRLDREPERLQVAPALSAKGVPAVGEIQSAQAGGLAAPDPGSITTPSVDFLGARLMFGGSATNVIPADQQVVLELKYQIRHALSDPHVGFKIRDRYGTVLYETNSYCLGCKPAQIEPGIPTTFRFVFRARIAPGEYTVTVGFADQGFAEGSFVRVLNYEHGVLSFQVVENIRGSRWSGLINLEAELESAEPLAKCSA